MTLAPFQVPASDPRRKLVDTKWRNALNLVNDRLSDPKNKWMAGSEFTAADIMVVFSFTTMRTFMQYNLSEYKGILEYLKRIGERDGYQRAMEKWDPQMDWRGAMKGESPPLFEGIRKMMESKV